LKKELKKQIKQDELVNGYERVYEWVRAHGDELKIGAIGVVVLIIVVSALVSFRNSRLRDAEDALGKAIALYAAPAPIEGQGEKLAEKIGRLKKALAAFDGVTQRYGSQAAGKRALYYSGLCRMELRDTDEAEKILKQVAAQMSDASIEPSLAKLALADLYRRKNAFDLALDQLRGLLDNPASQVPNDEVLMGMATLYEQAKRYEEANQAYRRVVEEYPASPNASEARRHSDHLKLALLSK
jgi:tetratricopeptide (TPR) repeat protein